jgi:hypothetical protein
VNGIESGRNGRGEKSYTESTKGRRRGHRGREKCDIAAVPKWRFLGFGENFAFRGTERKTAIQCGFGEGAKSGTDGRSQHF